MPKEVYARFHARLFDIHERHKSYLADYFSLAELTKEKNMKILLDKSFAGSVNHIKAKNLLGKFAAMPNSAGEEVKETQKLFEVMVSGHSLLHAAFVSKQIISDFESDQERGVSSIRTRASILELTGRDKYKDALASVVVPKPGVKPAKKQDIHLMHRKVYGPVIGRAWSGKKDTSPATYIGRALEYYGIAPTEGQDKQGNIDLLVKRTGLSPVLVEKLFYNSEARITREEAYQMRDLFNSRQIVDLFEIDKDKEPELYYYEQKVLADVFIHLSIAANKEEGKTSTARPQELTDFLITFFRILEIQQVDKVTLATKAGLDSTKIDSLEHGKGIPNVQRLHRIVRLLELGDVEYLLYQGLRDGYRAYYTPHHLHSFYGETPPNLLKDLASELELLERTCKPEHKSLYDKIRMIIFRDPEVMEKIERAKQFVQRLSDPAQADILEATVVTGLILGASRNQKEGISRIDSRKKIIEYTARPVFQQALDEMASVNDNAAEYTVENVRLQHRKVYGPVVGGRVGGQEVTNNNYLKRLYSYYGLTEKLSESTPEKIELSTKVAKSLDIEPSIVLHSLITKDANSTARLWRMISGKEGNIDPFLEPLGIDQKTSPELYQYEKQSLYNALSAPDYAQKKREAGPVTVYR